MLDVIYSGRFKKGLRLAQKRGLDISLLEDIVVKLKNGVPLDPNLNVSNLLSVTQH